MPSEEKIPAIELQQIKKYFPVTKGVIRDRIVGYVKGLDITHNPVTKGVIRERIVG